VHDLLLHLESKGFSGAPRFLGIDDQGREILSFLPGDVPRDLSRFSDTQLAVAAGLLRRYHDATADVPLVRNRGAEVMCHNDWGPTNAVFRDSLPCGLIDFDTVAPGIRLWDLGYSAFAWLDLGNSDYTGDEQIRRLSVMADAYGMPGYRAAQIAVHAVARQTALAVSGRVHGQAGMANWAASAASWTILNVTERLSPTGYALRLRI
jgi:Ser/Thr protein kinase RdoA (MazF antagonist)